MRFPVVALALIPVFSGCLVGERSALPDADTDLLPDEAELAGWTVRVYREPASCEEPTAPRELIEYHVQSHVYLDDNDTDGLTDVWERSFQTDPNLADTDGDGLTDKEEWDLRDARERFVRRGALWGANADSDGDCLTDGQELVAGFYIERLGRSVTSDPTDADGDRDGWTDVEEIFEHFTDPWNADTDGDGARDSQDVDPHRNITMYVEVRSLQVNRSGVSHVRVSGTLAGDLWDKQVWWPVPQGEEWGAPSQASPLRWDTRDLIGGRIIEVQFDWWTSDANGNYTGLLDFSPQEHMASTILHVEPAASRFWYVTRDGEPVDASGCTASGYDGYFTFWLRVGDASQSDLASDDLCAA